MTDIEIIEPAKVNFEQLPVEEKNKILFELYKDIHKLIEARMEEVSDEPIPPELFADCLIGLALHMQVETYNYLRENGALPMACTNSAYQFYTTTVERIKDLYGKIVQH